MFADIKADILRARPELEERFIQTPPPVLNFERFDIDFGRIEEVLGIKKEDFHTRQEVCCSYVRCDLSADRDSLYFRPSSMELTRY